MARGRIISKSWSASKKRARLYREAGELAEFCLQLFPLLVVHSDDYGCADADPETVKMICDPSCPRPVEAFAEALTQLQRVGLITRYETQGGLWFQIVKFDEHQPGLLSKRTTQKSPSPSPDTELPPDSALTKPNLTQPNLTQKSIPQTVSAADIVDLWNQLVTAPIPQVTKLTTDRRVKIDARLKTFPDLASWRMAITCLNAQAWCRAPGTGAHPQWTATIDWLCKHDGNIQRFVEMASTPVLSRREIPRNDWICPHETHCPNQMTCQVVSMRPVKAS